MKSSIILSLVQSLAGSILLGAARPRVRVRVDCKRPTARATLDFVTRRPINSLALRMKLSNLLAATETR
eukprot:1814405-Prymnesium_polylepis.1